MKWYWILLIALGAILLGLLIAKLIKIKSEVIVTGSKDSLAIKYDCSGPMPPVQNRGDGWAFICNEEKGYHWIEKK